LRPETEEIIAEVERNTGLAVQVIAVSDLGVLANVTTSPQATGSYVVRYRRGIGFKDYLVAFQCGHLLRLLALPESQRFQFAATGAAMQWGMKLVWGFLTRSSPPPPRTQSLRASQGS
jgi:hypothetical protein